MKQTSKISELKKTTAAVIIAAGYSSRMKAFKPLLPLGECTVLEHGLNTFLNAGIENIYVVLGHQGDKIEPVLTRHQIPWVYNENYHEGMYSSIVAGVKALPSNSTGFFLLPVDIPLVKSSTVEALLETYRRTGKQIIYPSYNHRKGHPPLIGSQLYSKILDYDGRGGLKTLLKKYEPEHQEYVNLQDEGILLDMDHYEEYQKIRKYINEKP